MVEQRHHGRPQEHRVGQAEAVRIGVRQALDQPDHVVAHVAEQSGRHQRQPPGRSIRLSAISWRRLASAGSAQGSNASAVEAGAPVDLGAVAAAAPDQVGLDAQDRIAAADRAAGHALQQEAEGAAIGELEQGRDRRLQVGHQRGRDHLRPARLVGGGEARRSPAATSMSRLPADRSLATFAP